MAQTINAAHNPFFRSFATEATVSQTAQALPQMGGAGWVRDLREAISLSEQQAQQGSTLPSFLQGAQPGARPLVEVVQAFAAATTQAQQMALLVPCRTYSANCGTFLCVA